MSDTETVWVKNCSNRLTIDVYHTDPDCRLLARANSTTRKPRRLLFDDVEECKVCGGTATPHSPSGDVQATRKRLLKASPEDLGLSPRGERR